MSVLPLSALFYQQINLATSCILANLSANGDTLANKGGHATEEEKPMISVPFRGGLKALVAKKSWNLWNAHISCVHMISSISGSRKFFSQESTANQWSIKCQAFSKNRIFGHNNPNLSDGNGEEFKKIYIASP